MSEEMNKVTISLEEYIELRQKAEGNILLLNKINILEENITNMYQRLVAVESFLSNNINVVPPEAQPQE